MLDAIVLMAASLLAAAIGYYLGLPLSLAYTYFGVLYLLGCISHKLTMLIEQGMKK